MHPSLEEADIHPFYGFTRWHQKEIPEAEREVLQERKVAEEETAVHNVHSSHLNTMVNLVEQTSAMK